MASHKREVPLARSGEILNEEFLKPLDITGNALALALRVPANRLYAIVEGKRGITPDTAFRLARYFGTTANFWINLQAHFDLENHRSELEDKIEREVQPRTSFVPLHAPSQWLLRHWVAVVAPDGALGGLVGFVAGDLAIVFVFFAIKSAA